MKVGYKKVKKKTPTTKRVAIKGIFGETVGYKTVKIKKTNTTKEKAKAKIKSKRKLKTMK